MRTRVRWIVTLLVCASPCHAAPTLDKLIFKGTHNSYSCRGGDNPSVSHAPVAQVDDFGVWALEFDIGVIAVGAGSAIAVGHDNAGDATCLDMAARGLGWPETYFLQDWLVPLRATQAIGGRYRPLLLYFDVKKDWLNGLTEKEVRAMARNVVAEVFGDSNTVDLATWVREKGTYPTVAEVAGKVVIYSPSARPSRGNLVGTWADHCTDSVRVAKAIATGAAPDDEGNACKGGCRVLRLDQYEEDWTFDYGVPPNPLVLDAAATPPWTVSDEVGDSRGCDSRETIAEHGTKRFPFKTVRAAVSRAQGATTNGTTDARKAGSGWTLLLRAGHYPEALTISVPLILDRDPSTPGPAIVGE